MRQAYVTEGIDESVVAQQATRRTEPTFIHHHSYIATCGGAEDGCYLVFPEGVTSVNGRTR